MQGGRSISIKLYDNVQQQAMCNCNTNQTQYEVDQSVITCISKFYWTEPHLSCRFCRMHNIHFVVCFVSVRAALIWNTAEVLLFLPASHQTAKHSRKLKQSIKQLCLWLLLEDSNGQVKAPFTEHM